MGCIPSKKRRAHGHTDLAGVKESAQRGCPETAPLPPPAYDATNSDSEPSLGQALKRVIRASGQLQDDISAIILLVEAGGAADTDQMAAQIHALLTLRVAHARKTGNGSTADKLARPVLDALEDQAKQPTLQAAYLAQLARAAESSTERDAAEWEEE